MSGDLPSSERGAGQGKDAALEVGSVLFMQNSQGVPEGTSGEGVFAQRPAEREKSEPWRVKEDSCMQWGC